MQEESQRDYQTGICKVQDYIDHHIEEGITADDLSEVSGFSKYHFSRVFHKIRKEALMHYTNRIRVERAKFYLAHRQDKNVTQIAFLLGFTDASVFSRTFKAYCRISPNDYRKRYSTNCNEKYLLSEYNKKTARIEGRTKLMVKTKVSIESLEEKQLIYVRHTGTYETLAEKYADMINLLQTEAIEQELLEKDSWVLAIYHDNPEFSMQEQFRTSLCMSVSKEKMISETKNIGKMSLAAGQYAVGHFRIKQEDYAGAWNYMYQVWMKNSTYRPRNSYPFEVYRNNPKTDESGIHMVDIYMPIEKISF